MKGELSGEMNGKDIVFAFCMLVCGFLYWNLINAAGLGLGVTLFAAALCAATLVYLRASGFRQSKQSLIFLGIIALSAANFTLFDGTLIKGLNFIFLSLAFVYWVCISTGMRLENRISIYVISDMLRQLFMIPFGNFEGCFQGVRQVFAKNKKGKGVLGGIVGILIFLPVLILVASLLTDADAAFESLIDKLRFSVSENMMENLLDVILGLPVACYLYGLIYGNRYRRKAGNATLKSVDGRVKAFRFAPGAAVFSALTALNLIYAVFFLAQTSYLFSAFRDSLPQSMTYAEYARRGFFELCAVSGINLAVITAAHLIAKRDHVKVLRAETVALCIFTIALIATAMSKMGMYVSSYGLTQLRVYTSWFMIVLLLVFVIVLLRQFRSFNGTRIAAAGFICLFMILCYGNVDGMIAKYNIERYQAGTLASLNAADFSGLSDGAVPYLYEGYLKIDDPKIKEELSHYVIKGPTEIRPEGNFRDFNFQSDRADRIREGL
ncbi:MAG TPA: DUF4173 domain-containing protein [Bacillota bacterium]|nr:DUF4173 domain-containing protein [Bacillota bacterium]